MSALAMTPKKFGRYEVVEEIGDGAMGRVYRCVDPLMRRTVAVKTVKSEYLTRETAEDYLRRFRREAQAAGRLAHPSIVGIYDVGENYFVMEYLEGTTLLSVLKTRVKLPLDEALGVLAPLADALDFAHRSGIVHRDIKPANVMVLADGRPKLMDFGVAHLESSVATATGHFFGSPSYMAPEQVSGGEVTFKADLFAFAVVAYETVTGQRPFQGDSITAVMYRVVNEVAPPPRQWDFDLPPSYDDIFKRALSKNPAERFPDATSLVAALQQKDFDAALLEAFSIPGPDASPQPSPGEQVANLVANLVTGTGPSVATGDPIGSVDTMALSDLPPDPYTITTARMKRATIRQAALGVVLVLIGLWVLMSSTGRRPGGLLAGGDSQNEHGPPPFRIESEPAGAQVFLDDAAAGRTPIAVPSVKPGRHKVRVSAEGFAPAELSLELVPGTTVPPLRFVMEPVTGRLEVKSEPPEAAVKVDGKLVGQTPLQDVFLTPGRHEVRLEKKGFQPNTQRVYARVGQTAQVSARLDVADVRPPATPRPEPSMPGWVAEGDFVEVDGSVTPPRKISGEWAPYPEAARRLRLLGTVKVDMVVNEAGEPTDLHVVESAGELLDRAVLDAIRKWRFEPAQKNGVKVKVRWPAKQSFVLPSD